MSVTRIHHRLCFDCDNALVSRSGVYCRLFAFDVFDENLANDCEFFEPLPEGPVTFLGASTARAKSESTKGDQ